MLHTYKKRGIYIFTNKINGKKYVGKSVYLQERIRCHKRLDGKSVFHSALKKYGWDNFDLQLITLGDISNKDLLDLEETFIFLESSLVTENGYNVCKNGTDKTGVKLPKEQIQKMSKRVIQYNTDGKMIKIWDSIAEAQRVLQIHQISLACNKKSIHAGGFLWSFENDIKPKKVNIKDRPNLYKKVNQFDMDGNYIRQYPSINIASQITKSNAKSISGNCTGRRNSHNGFIWCYEDVEPNLKFVRRNRKCITSGNSL